MSALIHFDKCNDIYIYKKMTNISMKTIEIILIPYAKILQHKKRTNLEMS